jgi:transcription antitermination factor NusG
MSEKKWYAVYTRTRWEKKVAETLTKKKIENYCPLNKVKRQWADRKKIVEEPLFTSYVFVRASNIEQLPLLKTDGVINFVYWLGKPAVIRDNEIEMIQKFLNEHNNISLERSQVNVHDFIRVISGPLITHQGQVVAVNKNTVKIVLPSLGFIMSAEVEISSIELLQDKYRYFGSKMSKIGTG